MSGSEELIRQARLGAEGALPKSPRRRAAVIACIDARVRPELVLGGEPGDYHVFRNGGGLVTGDAIRSLMVSQFYGTDQIIVMMHTDCAAMAYPATEERARLEAETGQPISFDLHESFTEIESELRRGVELLRTTPLLPNRDKVKGVIFDVNTQRLTTVID